MQVQKRLIVLVAVAIVGLAALLAAPGSADAQAGPPPHVRLDIHGDFGWYNNGGVGARVDIPIVPDGFIRNSRVLKDDLSISPGLELLWWWTHKYEGIGFIPMVMVQYNLYVGNHWSFLGELGIAFLWGPSNWNHDYYRSYIAPTGQVGARWHFSDAMALLFRIGWPAGAQVGLAIDL